MVTFDERTIQNLKYYVYLLLDPYDHEPFYVGKGKGNRVFNHMEDALDENFADKESLKLDTIRKLHAQGLKPEHLIVRHGLDEQTAFDIEASLMDVLQFLKFKTTNIAGGHNSIEKGLMTSDEIIRLYNAEKLNAIEDGCIIININKKYKRGSGDDAIYEATKEAWGINKNKLDSIKYVLSEYKGLIVEVFAVEKWYPVEVVYNPGSKNEGKTRVRYGFIGKPAPENVRNKYINKSIAHHKKKGDASPFRYKL